MKSIKLAAAVAAVFVFVQSAQARTAHHVAHHVTRPHVSMRAGHHTGEALRAYASAGPSFAMTTQHDELRTRWRTASGGYRGGAGGRPAAWCGWEMRQLVGQDPGPSYNLARNWARWGRAGAAGIGAVVVWPHHVGKIVGRENGEWVIESGNDGHAVRTRPRSIAGAIAFRWG